MKVIEINPVIDDAGIVHLDWCKHIVVDDNGNPLNYNVLQVETGFEYFEPLDLHPCHYTYVVGSEIKEESEDEVLENEIEESKEE